MGTVPVPAVATAGTGTVPTRPLPLPHSQSWSPEAAASGGGPGGKAPWRGSGRSPDLASFARLPCTAEPARYPGYERGSILPVNRGLIASMPPRGTSTHGLHSHPPRRAAPCRDRPLPDPASQFRQCRNERRDPGDLRRGPQGSADDLVYQLLRAGPARQGGGGVRQGLSRAERHAGATDLGRHLPAAEPGPAQPRRHRQRVHHHRHRRPVPRCCCAPAS